MMRRYTILVGERSVPVSLPMGSTVFTLKLRLANHELREEARTRDLSRARAVGGGRVLRDNEVVDEFVPEDGAIHIALPAEVVSPAAAAAMAPGGDVELGAQTNPPYLSADGTERRGFDRLMALGLDSDDVAVLRQQFEPEVIREFGSLPRLPGETETARLFRMEEAWLRSQGDDSPLALNLRPLLLQRTGGGGGAWGHQGRGARDDEDLSDLMYDGTHGGGRSGSESGTAASLMWGVAAGWMFGFIALLFALSPNASRRFKVGVMVGLVMNIALSIAMATSQPAGKNAGTGSSSGTGSGSDAWGGEGAGPSSDSGAGGPPGKLIPVDLDKLGS